MAEYTITLTEDRLKVNFSATFINPTDCMITLHEVIYDSIGPREGFSIGDRLLAINDQFVCNMTIAEISAAFDRPERPVMLTLNRCFDDDASDISLSTFNTVSKCTSQFLVVFCLTDTILTVPVILFRNRLQSATVCQFSESVCVLTMFSLAHYLIT